MEPRIEFLRRFDDRADEAGTAEARADATGERSMWIERFWRVS
jgi:hypothetical protein